MVDPIPFGNYYLLERVNVGGMAEIFKAKSFGVEGFSRILAVKRILPNMAEDEEFINMFVDEAKISVQLNHANIVQIYELGRYDSSYYIAMEYVPGRDLRQLLDRYRKAKNLMPLAQAAYITSKICDGLDYAHRKTDTQGHPLNIIHRDVSPQNIMISYEGAVKVLDFGIAKAEDRASKTQAGVLKGKFGYMSPEQVRGQTIDHRSDIFAVGVIFYEMVTGKRLFVGESDFSTLEKVRNADVPPPSSINPNVTPELEQVIMKALAKSPDDRYQWASDFSEDLQQFLITEGTVYTAKKLSNFLKEIYAEDIEIEASKMEEYAKIIDPPPDASNEIKASHGAKKESDDVGEMKTVIFGANELEAIKKGQDPMAAAANHQAAPKNNQRNRQPEPPPMDLSSMPTGIIQAPMLAQMSGTMQPPPMMGGYNSGQFYPNTTAGFQYPPMQQQNRNNMALFIGLGVVVVLVLAFLLFYVILSPGTPNYATLSIETIPRDIQVAVFIDDYKVSDSTPFIKNDLPAGEHTIVLKANGYQEATFKANAFPGQPLSLVHRMEPGGNALPQATPTNNKPAAAVQQPIAANNAPAENQAAATAPTNNAPAENQAAATAPANTAPAASQPVETTPPPAAKEPEIGRVVVNSNPPATVYVNRGKAGETPYTIEKQPGENITIEVTKQGFVTAKKSVTVPANGESINVDFQLEKKVTRSSPPKQPRVTGSATLMIHTPKSPGTKILINGRDTGKVVPQMNLAIPAGKVTITLVNGSKKKNITKNIHNGEKVKIIDKDF